jgi:hypothetical protein
MRGILAPLLIAAFEGGCWMSTIPPPEHARTGEVEVYGLVYQVHDGVAVHVPDTWVRVTWMRRTPSGSLVPWSEPDVLGTGPGGSYRIRHSADSWVQGIRVEALTCRWNPDKPDPAIRCCLKDRPTCPGCEAVWLGGTVRTVRPGETTCVDVTILCGP